MRRKAAFTPILDATCGSRMIWFQKDCPYATFIDQRHIDDEIIWEGESHGKHAVRKLSVKPDIVADFTNMPFKDDTFWLVVFDPPHLKCGKNSWLTSKYGSLDKNWPIMIRDGFNECLRVLKPYGTLIFKWSEYQIPVNKVWKAIGHTPLFGTRCGRVSKTIWATFMKFPETKEVKNA